MVHFGGATDFLKNDLKKSYWDLFHQAVDKQAFISFDPNYRQDLFKLSLEEAMVLYGTTHYQDLE